jgi:hypothetical protein
MAVQLIKDGRQAEAQALLKAILESDLHNIHAWVWYVETLPTLQQRIRALEMCSRYNPGNERVKEALTVLKTQQTSSMAMKSQPAQSKVPGGKICPHCGAQVQEWAKICTTCGEPLQKRFSLPRLNLSFALPSSASLASGLRKVFVGISNLGATPLLFLLPVIVICLVGFLLIQKPAETQNVLAIGDLAKIKSIDMMIQSPKEFDFMDKDEILVLRRDAIYRYPSLLFTTYEPSEAVFGQIVDGLPWWGIAGQFYYGQGEQSVEGSSEESRFILNPYLLVAAEPCGMWDRNRVPEQLVHQPNFLFYCEATNLHWEPEISYGEITYDAECVTKRNYSCFNLIAYNARDLSLKYLYVSYKDSTRITKQEPPQSAVAIPQYIHQGDSCGYVGGCNNMSPDTPEMESLSVTGLPAEAVIWLWKDEPSSLEETPDMTFVIHFK